MLRGMGEARGDTGRLRALFERATGLPPDGRAQLLEDPTLSPEIRQELRALLEADRGSDTYFSRTFAPEAGPAPGIGERFGSYETRSLIGQGGMGMVFLADRVDGEIRQTVAVKIVRQVWFDPRALDRFRNERQVLAGLVHANIARLLDGGTRGDGIPYLVMEYVDGIPLDRYCDRHQLAIADRLRLFLPVCDAVEYAHGRLIIHRDLKPSNVLVTAAGEPKLLDFGIAKALDGVPGEQTGTVALTPDFASPEQVRGETPTTATDVYGLGGVLYFLLTGQPAHAIAGLSAGELRRAICETPPRPPSELRAELKGDLENILLKALHLEPSRRYRSAREFREDIERFLERRPVAATRDGWGYRTRRFVERHRFAAAAGALTAVAVIGGTGESLYQAHRANKRFAQVRALTNRFVFDFEAAIRYTPGTLEARRMVASTARQYLADLAADAGKDPAMNRELAESYFRLSMVEIEAGESPQGLKDLQHSVALLKKLKDDCCGTPEQRGQYVIEMSNLAAYQSDAKETADANRSSDEAVRVAREWVAQSHGNARASRELANALLSAGMLRNTQGKPLEARAMFEEARRLESAAGSAGQNDTARFVDATAAYQLARTLDALGESRAALDTARDARSIMDSLRAAHPENSQWIATEVQLLGYTGDILERLGKEDASLRPEATDAFQIAYALARDQARRSSGDKSALESACFASMQLANHMDHLDRTVEAIPILTESIEDSNELVRADPSSRRYRYIEVSDRHLMASYMVNLKRWPDAESALAKADGLMTEALAKSPDDLQLLRRKVLIRVDQTRVERIRGNLAEARVRCQQALDLTATLIERQKGAKRPIGGALQRSALVGDSRFHAGGPGNRMSGDGAQSVTLLLARVRQGEDPAREALWNLVYAELRRLAQIAFQREGPGHTLQPTALVHEAFLRLFDGPVPAFADRAHFLAISARVMRQVLVDHARARRARKRGVQFTVPLNDQIAAGQQGDLLEMDEALDRLGREEPRLVTLIEMRFIAGMTAEETAEVRGESVHTVRRDLRYAQARLRTILDGPG